MQLPFEYAWTSILVRHSECDVYLSSNVMFVRSRNGTLHWATIEPRVYLYLVLTSHHFASLLARNVFRIVTLCSSALTHFSSASLAVSGLVPSPQRLA